MRYTWLDGLRGIAAMAVMFVHYRFLFNPLWPPADWPAYSVLWPLYDHGDMAVPVFWCLSGFVFAATYLNKPVDGRDYFVRRFSRLYPLHFATLLYVAALPVTRIKVNGAHFTNDAWHFVLQLFLATDWLPRDDYSFNWPIWSVSAEVLSYMLFFAFLKIGRTGLAYSALVAFTFLLLARLVDYPALTCAIEFFAGVTAFHLSRHRWAFWAGLSALPVCGLLAFIHPAPLYFGCIPALILTVGSLESRVMPVPPRWRWIGDSTFAIYLLQVPVVLTALMLGVRNPAGPLPLIAYLATVIGLAALTYRYFELPAQRAIRRWTAPAAKADAPA